MDYAIAIDILRPGAKWRRADDYQTLVETWEDETAVPADQELIAAYEEWVAEQQAAEAEVAQRKQLAKDWAALSDQGLDYIEGPYQWLFDAAAAHLDKEKPLEVRKELAIKMIEQLGEPTDYISLNLQRLATFQSVKQQFIDKINALGTVD